MGTTTSPLYLERYPHLWIGKLLIVVAVGLTIAGILLYPVEALATYIMLSVAALHSFLAYAFGDYTVRLQDDELLFGYRMARKRYSVSELQGAKVRRYKMFVDFLGWGLRLNPRTGEWGYIIGGTLGAQVTSPKGYKITFTCKGADELVNLLHDAGVPSSA